MRNRRIKILLISILRAKFVLYVSLIVLISCNPKIHDSYHRIIDEQNDFFSLKLDQNLMIFELQSKTDYIEEYKIRGNYSIKGRRLFLMPNPGEIIVSERDTSNINCCEFIVKDGMTGEIISSHIGTNDMDTIFFSSVPVYINLAPKDSIIVSSIGYDPLIFQLRGSGEYEVKLFKRIRNVELLNWKIKNNRIVTFNGVFILDMQ